MQKIAWMLFWIGSHSETSLPKTSSILVTWSSNSRETLLPPSPSPHQCTSRRLNSEHSPQAGARPSHLELSLKVRIQQLFLGLPELQSPFLRQVNVAFLCLFFYSLGLLTPLPPVSPFYSHSYLGLLHLPGCLDMWGGTRCSRVLKSGLCLATSSP